MQRVSWRSFKSRRPIRGARATVAGLFVLSVVGAASVEPTTRADADGASALRAVAPTVTTAPPTTLPPTTLPPTTVALPPSEPTTSAPRPPAVKPPLRAAAAPVPQPAPLSIVPRAAPPAPGTLDAYRGLGTWVDVYDWSVTYAQGEPPVGLADVDRMADVGVQTLYIQASK